MRTVVYSLVYSLAIASVFFPSIAWGQTHTSISPSIEISQTQANLDQIVVISLPKSATVWFKAGGSSTGQVMGFEAKKQILTLGQESIPFTKINKVTFDRNAIAYKSDGKRIIRGERTTQVKPESWRNVPLDAFRVKDPQLGQAQVNLTGVINPLKLRGIQDVAANSVYVVEEIEFQGGRKMKITATATDR